MEKKDLVLQIPIDSLSDQTTSTPLKRLRDLSGADIRELLRTSSIEFVIANVGLPLKWIALEDTFKFWKENVSSHVVDPEVFAKGLFKNSFPGQFAYAASEWGGSANVVVLLETYH